MSIYKKKGESDTGEESLVSGMATVKNESSGSVSENMYTESISSDSSSTSEETETRKITEIILQVAKENREEEYLSDKKYKRPEISELQKEYFKNKSIYEETKHLMKKEQRIINKIILSFEEKVYFGWECEDKKREKNLTIRNDKIEDSKIISDWKERFKREIQVPIYDKRQNYSLQNQKIMPMTKKYSYTVNEKIKNCNDWKFTPKKENLITKNDELFKKFDEWKNPINEKVDNKHTDIYDKKYFFTPIICNTSQNEMNNMESENDVIDWAKVISESEEKEINYYNYGQNNKREKFRPYACPEINCKKCYTSLYGLKYHQTHGHTKTFEDLNKPYKCEVSGCDKTYKNLNGLKYHLENSH